MSRFWLGFGDLQIGNWWKMSRSWFVFLESFKDATGGSLRSELTSGVGWTKLLRVGLGFGRFQKDNWWFCVACREFLKTGGIRGG